MTYCIGTYWIATGLVGLFLAVSAGAYLLHLPTIDGIRKLGFPDFFRVELAVLKLLAAVVIVVPSVPAPLKEWAYAGVVLFLATAMIAHHAHGDPIALNLINLLILAVVIVSYSTK